MEKRDTHMANEEQANAERFDLVQEYAEGLLQIQEPADMDPESTYAVVKAGLAHIESGFGGGGLEITPTCSAFLELNLDRKYSS